MALTLAYQLPHQLNSSMKGTARSITKVLPKGLRDFEGGFLGADFFTEEDSKRWAVFKANKYAIKKTSMADRSS
jgi:hypothetical protein